MPLAKHQENVTPEHNKYLITSQRELQSKMSSQEMHTLYMVKNRNLLKRNLKSIASGPQNLQTGTTIGRRNIPGGKKEVSFIKPQLREEARASLSLCVCVCVVQSSC